MPVLAAAVCGGAPCTTGRQQHQYSAAAALAPCRLRQRPFFGEANLLAQPSSRPSSSGRQLQAAVSNVAAPDQRTMEANAVFGKGKVVKVRGAAAACRRCCLLCCIVSCQLLLLPFALCPLPSAMNRSGSSKVHSKPLA